MATLNLISCDQFKEIELMREENIIITTGRKRGKSLICVSDSDSYPCKYKIATINDGIDTTKAIESIFSFTPPKNSQLNETVERLFLKPSTLMR